MAVQPWVPHPVIGEPTWEEVQALAARSKIEPALAAQYIARKRKELIRKIESDMFNCGYEPPIWKVIDALYGVPWIDQEWAERMRHHLQFSKPVRTVLILGGQRGGKSEYGTKHGMKRLRKFDRNKAWFLHQNIDMSVQYQQPLIWKFMDQTLKAKDIRTRTTYIKYSDQNGFTERRFILPNGSDGVFKTYEQGIESVEGGNVNFVYCDELVPVEYVQTIEFRVAEKNGNVLITFTPVDGYSPTVQMFMDGARVVKESIAYLLPKDGGPPDVARALGLSGKELARLERHLDDPKRNPPVSVWSRPEQCGEWLNQPQAVAEDAWGEGTGYSQPREPDGRKFERLPRVLKTADPEEGSAIVLFHSSDNPFGNPLSVWRKAAKMDPVKQKIRFYGFTTKMATLRFPKFDPKVHVIREQDIPNDGTDYLFVDPCSDRNWFMLWIRKTPDALWVRREWPGHYEVPGEGIPGAWTMTDGKRLDGRAGPAQKSFGWGYTQYKREIARLEGWQDYENWLENGTTVSDEEEISGWYQYGEARELIYERYMDARFGNVKSFDAGGMQTLIEDIEENVKLTFVPTSNEGEGRDSITSGCAMINDALYWDESKPVSFFNRPKLYIADCCLNLIFAMQIYTGQDGQKGACKDPIDCLRMAFLKKIEYVPNWMEARLGRARRKTTTSRGGGAY